MPEPYAKIIKKLTIINECVSNLKLIEPKFNIENAKYAKVDLDYNWAQNYFKKETEFGVTSDISIIKATSDKTKHPSPPEKIKEEFTDDDFDKLYLSDATKPQDNVKSIVKKLNTEANLTKFKTKFNNLSSDTLKCDYYRKFKLLFDNTDSTYNLRQFIAQQKTYCPSQKKDGSS